MSRAPTEMESPITRTGTILNGDAAASERQGTSQGNEPGDDGEAARRYARLLVSEIKLYHEAAVAAGRRESNGSFGWDGAFGTHFWVDPQEDLTAVFMTQFLPSGTFNFRGQLKSIVYGALAD